jgi:zinc D-Ala-D-Ala carboxypeptidase
MRKTIIAILAIALLLVVLLWWRSDHASAPVVSTSANNSRQAEQKPVFNKKAYSVTDPASPWVIVNKQNPIKPLTYSPADLRKPQVTLRVPGATEMQMRAEAATALEDMFAAANTDGMSMQVSTAYRGLAYQKVLYDTYIAEQGQEIADSVSARPGYSEHQTGWAVDIRSVPDTCGLEICFSATPEGKWLAANAYKHGFLLRYPSGKEEITGYNYEPWHFRYIGKSLSQELYDRKILTLEEFFDVPGGSAY